MTYAKNLRDTLSKIRELEKIVEEMQALPPIVDAVKAIWGDEQYEAWMKSEDERFFRGITDGNLHEPKHHGFSQNAAEKRQEACVPEHEHGPSRVPNCMFEYFANTPTKD